jgi:hypothetical protein
MKFPWHAPQSPKEWVLIAAFNGARIVGNLAGTIRIRGGTPAERAEARAWREQFLIETPLPPLEMDLTATIA